MFSSFYTSHVHCATGLHVVFTKVSLVFGSLFTGSPTIEIHRTKIRITPFFNLYVRYLQNVN